MLKITDLLREPFISEPQLLDRALLIGGPGIGKTTVVRLFAEACAKRLGREFVDVKEVMDDVEFLRRIYEEPCRYFVFCRIVASHVFPEDVSFPRDRGEYIVFVSPLVLKVLSRRGIAGVLFVDEINLVERRDQRAMYYSLLQEKELGWCRLSDDVIVVAAGNDPESNPDVVELPSALINRLTVLRVEPPTVDEWISYMSWRYGTEWEGACGVFLKLHESRLYVPPSKPCDCPYPSPRSWERLARRLYLARRHLQDADRYVRLATALAEGTLGLDVAREFVSFLRLYLRFPSPEEVLNKFEELWHRYHKNVEERFLLLWFVASLAEKRLDKVLEVCRFLNEHGFREELMFLLCCCPASARPRLAEVLGVDLLVFDVFSMLFG